MYPVILYGCLDRKFTSPSTAIVSVPPATRTVLGAGHDTCVTFGGTATCFVFVSCAWGGWRRSGEVLNELSQVSQPSISAKYPVENKPETAVV